MRFPKKLTPLLIAILLSTSMSGFAQEIQYGVRPYYLIDAMKDGPLKSKLRSCAGMTPRRSLFSIAHRGAPLEFPEHTVQSNCSIPRQADIPKVLFSAFAR
jgi:glycerophosphoryl diester phosphodiesterase